MSDLPSGWETAPLGNVVNSSVGGMWGSATDSEETTLVQVIRAAEFRDWAKSRAQNAPPRFVPDSGLASRRLEIGDIVLEVSGGGPTQPVGRTVLIDEQTIKLSDRPLICSNFCRRLVLSDYLDPLFIWYQLHYRYLQGDTDKYQRATTNIRNLQVPQYLEGTRLVVPPRTEQERIVAAIEEQFSGLDAGVAAVERARQNLRRMRASVLQAAITGTLLGGTEAWEERPLGDLIVDIHAGKSFKCDERPAHPDEWGVVKVSAMTWGEFRESENKTVLPGRNIDERLEIRAGDVLLSRSNTVGYVGAVVKVAHCRPKLLLSDKSLRIVPSAALTPDWLVISLRSKPARRYIEAVATGTSDSMRNISQPKIRALRIPVPTLDEQRRLTAEVDRQLAILSALASTLEVLTRKGSSCRSAILAAAFSGDLVPQDPREQSASALLKEITAERSSLNGHQPRRVRQPHAPHSKALA